MGGQRKQIVAGGDGFQDGTIVNADVSASAAIDISKISGAQASDATLTSIAALGTAADKTLYTTGIDTWAETAITSFGRSLIDDAAASNARTTLGLVIGTDVQAQDATLASLAALGTAADKIAYTTGIDTWAEAAITSFGRSLIDDAAASNARTTLGLVIGTDVQAYDAELAALAGLTSAADKLPYFTGSGTADVAAFTAAGRAIVDDADAAAQRTTLGLGTIATQASSSVSISGGSITGITDLAIADGGTGASTQTAAMDALSPTTTKGDLLVDDGTNVIRVAVGSNDQVLTADSAQASGVKWAAAGGSTPTRLDASTGYYIGWDCFDAAKLNSVSGTAAATTVSTMGTGEGVAGVQTQSTGTDTTGRSGSLLFSNQSPEYGLGEGTLTFTAYIKIPTLSDGTNTFTVKVGLGTSVTAVADTDAIRFVYASATSANWRYSTIASSAETVTSSSTAVGTGWTHLKWVLNAAGTSVEFFVDGVSLGTNTTNIPLNSSGMSYIHLIIKSAGTTSRDLSVDYVEFYNTFTTARS